MVSQLFQILLELIIADISILFSAKGLQADRIGEQTGKLAILFWGTERKNTTIQYLVLCCNIVFILAKICFITVNYINGATSVLDAISNIWNQICQNWHFVLLFLFLSVAETVFFMRYTYRSIQTVYAANSDGNRHMSSSEIDSEYIQFSEQNCIDTRSPLLLIAGDLSFLGDVPDISVIKKDKEKRRCQENLRRNAPPHQPCQRKCPVELQCACIEKSRQFAQLIDLQKKGITLHIICKPPRDNGDDAYKRRLGRLKKIFGDCLHIHFMSDDLATGICVLGRIKLNGGIEELFWHWKDPEHPGQYTVPNIKRADTSENKTLIYLLKNVLWDYTEDADTTKIDEYVEQYKSAIK